KVRPALIHRKDFFRDAVPISCHTTGAREDRPHRTGRPPISEVDWRIPAPIASECESFPGGPGGISKEVQMRLFKNRIDAANELAQHLAFLKEEKPIVLGLANGGVPIAEVIAKSLDAPLDVLLIEKLYAPHSPGQVVGAVDEHGRISMIQATARWHHVTSQQMVEPAREAFRLLQTRQARVRSILPEVDVRGRPVVVVGQGVATGAKMLD